MNAPAMEMPRYQSHKKVWALKIKAFEPIEGEGGKLAGMMMHPEEPGYAPLTLSGAYMSKHQPKVGGYYVVYDDGYASWSPVRGRLHQALRAAPMFHIERISGNGVS